MDKFKFFKNDLIILLASLTLVGLTFFYRKAGLCNHEGRFCRGVARGFPFTFLEQSSQLKYFGVKLLGFFSDWAIWTLLIFLLWLGFGFLKSKRSNA